MVTPTTHTTEWLDSLRENFRVDVSILARYYPIEEVGMRAFDNNKTAILENLNRLIEQALQDYEYTGDIKGDCTCGHAKHFRGTWDSCDSCSCQNFTPLKATKKEG